MRQRNLPRSGIVEKALAAIDRAAQQREIKHDDTTILDYYRRDAYAGSLGGGVRSYDGRFNRRQRGAH